MKLELTDKLEKLNTYPFHMPGHKRNKSFNIPCSDIDITEIDGFDNLHNPCEILDNLQKDIADTFGYSRSIISVNGSSCGVLASILALTNKGDEIIIARNCHKSVYNACYLNELDVHYIEPEYNEKFGCYGKITQSSVDNAIELYPKSKCIVITSPSYEGFISNIYAQIPVIIDSAHGAHFGFADYLPEKAVGDIVIQSLHKTLPCLTQCAVIHINNDELYDKVKMYMDILETSSPSYVLLSSIDRCIDFLNNSEKDFQEYKNLLDDFYSFTSSLDYVSILDNDDITRIILSVKGYSGKELSDILRDDYSIEVEGYGISYIILISTVCDTSKGFEMLKNALKNINPKDSEISLPSKPVIPEKICKSSQIEETAELDFENTIGKVCAEYIYAYPPGSPIIVPGEKISEEVVNYIRLCIDMGVNIISDGNIMELKILTKN